MAKTMVRRDINSAIVRVSNVDPESKINFTSSIVPPQSNLRGGGFGSVKTFVSKTETGFRKTNASSNELNQSNNQRLNNNRPTTTGNNGSRQKTVDSSIQNHSSGTGLKSLAQSKYQSNFIGGYQGAPGNPLP